MSFFRFQTVIKLLYTYKYASRLVSWSETGYRSSEVRREKNSLAGNTEQKPNQKKKKKGGKFFSYDFCALFFGVFATLPQRAPVRPTLPPAPPLAAGHVQARRPWRWARRQRRGKAPAASPRPRPGRRLLYRRDVRGSPRSRRRRHAAGGARRGVQPRVQRAARLRGYNTADARPRRRDPAGGGGRWRRTHQVQP